LLQSKVTNCPGPSAEERVEAWCPHLILYIILPFLRDITNGYQPMKVLFPGKMSRMLNGNLP
jgi:hypothetical protein